MGIGVDDDDDDDDPITIINPLGRKQFNTCLTSLDAGVMMTCHWGERSPTRQEIDETGNGRIFTRLPSRDGREAVSSSMSQMKRACGCQ